jgi:hypothetical protein
VSRSLTYPRHSRRRPGRQQGNSDAMLPIS